MASLLFPFWRHRMTGAALRQARERAHLSQADLARDLGVSVRTVQQWEAGRTGRPFPRHRARLARFLETHGEKEAAA